jgi:Type II CAAX prenyl endopeptidase Rce1-like
MLAIGPVRKRGCWVLLAAVALGCALLSYRLFPLAFPIVSLDIRLDRAGALRVVRQMAAAQHWGPPGAVRDVASFEVDSAVQSFVELEGGGRDAFIGMMREGLFSPYTWRVRRFQEGEVNQTTVWLKPGGEPYGFVEKLREDAPGPSMASAAARAMAERTATAAPWGIRLEQFALVETAQEVKPGGRTDHTFVYERPDRKVGEGRYRLRLVVSGDRLTELAEFVQIPQAFTRRYEQMRSTNNAIATGSAFIMFLLYLGAGCGVGLFFLLRGRLGLWRQPLVAAGVIAGLQLLAGLNAWPLAWMHYDTALSSQGFIARQLAALLASSLGLGILLFVSFAAAEGLSRRAFPHQPQLWRLWEPGAGSSTAVLGRTLGGYLVAAITLLYMLLFYYVVTRHFGWWTPAEPLADPNSLAHVLPWLTPFANSAQAGCWEESLFRAVPLAGAALLGNRWGGRRWWIAGAFLLQALVFGSAHANYPNEPAYARLVELIVPSFIFGGLYLRYGLLPSMLLHFIYDLVLMSLPLFATASPGVWVDQTIVVLLGLIPVWVVLGRRWQTGRWGLLPAGCRNGEWQIPPPPEPPVAQATIVAPAAAAPWLTQVMGAAAVAGAIAWILATTFVVVVPPLQLKRTDALRLASEAVAQRGANLPPRWQTFATIGGGADMAGRFVWRTSGRAVYQSLLGDGLMPACWHVRFASFEGDVAERAEEWQVWIGGDGRVLRVRHQLPEARSGAILSETDARARAQTAVRERFQIDPAGLKEISAKPNKHPARMDWTFVFRDPSGVQLTQGERRLSIDLAGDQLADAQRFVFVPEAWERAQRRWESVLQIGSILRGVLMAIAVLVGAGAAIVSWSRGRFAVAMAVVPALALLAVNLASMVNRWPTITAGFSTAQPYALQRTILAISLAIGALVVAAIMGLVTGLTAPWLRGGGGSLRTALVLGGGIGLAGGGAEALVARLHSGANPPWPSLQGAAECWPMISPVLGVVSHFIVSTATLALICGGLDRLTSGWTRRRALWGGLAFLLWVLSSQPSDPATVGPWAVSALLSGSVLFLAYALVLRLELSVLPLVAGVMQILDLVREAVQRAYPGALAGALLGMPVVAALAWLWFVALRRSGGHSAPGQLTPQPAAGTS